MHLDLALSLLLFSLFGMIFGLIFAATEHEKIAWVLCLPVSLAYIALPFVLVRYGHGAGMLVSLSSIFQPHWAQAILGLWFFLLCIAGVVGLCIWLITAYFWYRRHMMQSP